MIIKDLESEFSSLTGSVGFEREINSMFTGDLLSHVLANAKDGDILITVQNNLNTIAVATLINLPLIIFPNGIEASAELINRARMERVAVFKSNLSSKDIILRLARLGVK